jgi:hypothetical protein
MAHYGPAPPPELAAPNEHLPSTEAAVLRGHEGPVLAVRFNSQGTYCLSCGKVGLPLCCRPIRSPRTHS